MAIMLDVISSILVSAGPPSCTVRRSSTGMPDRLSCSSRNSFFPDFRVIHQRPMANCNVQSKRIVWTFIVVLDKSVKTLFYLVDFRVIL